MKNSTQFDEQEDVLVDEEQNLTKKLFLLNDNHNIASYVIEVLCTVMGFDPIRAEQCVTITHFKGSCSIKEGSYEDLSIYRLQFTSFGISTEIK